MSMKTNMLNPVPVFGYQQHGDLQCNTPMNAAFCRMRQQDALQSKYNTIHYPSTKEGFSTINGAGTKLNELFNTVLNFIKSLFTIKEGMESKSDCKELIDANHTAHQLPSFSKSKVSPIDNNHNNKLVNELYLKQCFDSEYDDNVGVSSVPDTLIQNQ
jgi:hypothetical protein